MCFYSILTSYEMYDKLSFILWYSAMFKTVDCINFENLVLALKPESRKIRKKINEVREKKSYFSLLFTK